MIDFDFVTDKLHISVCTDANDCDMYLYITAPMEMTFTAKEVGVKITLEDTLIDRAEHVWLIEGLNTDELYDLAVKHDWHEFESIDWGMGCLTSEYASQYEYLRDYVREDHVSYYVDSWLMKNINVA